MITKQSERVQLGRRQIMNVWHYYYCIGIIIICSLSEIMIKFSSQVIEQERKKLNPFTVLYHYHGYA